MTRAKLISALTITALLSGAVVATAQSGPQGGARGNAPHPHMAAPMIQPMGLGWAAADTNGDGKVDSAEADAALKARFAGADADGNGLISAEELAAAIKAMEEERADARRLAMAKRFIDRADDNGDGSASADELRVPRGAADFVRRFDIDKDGVVTQEEYAAQMKALHDRMEKGKNKGPKGDRAGRGDRGKGAKERHGDGKSRAERAPGQKERGAKAAPAPAPAQN